MSLFQSGTVLVLLGTLLLSFKSIWIKLVYAEGLDVATLLFLRFTLSVPMFWAVVAAKGKLRELRTVGKRALAVALGGGLILSATIWADFIALSHISASLQRVILYTFPAFIVVFSAALKRKWPARNVLAALLAAEAGLVLAVGGGGWGDAAAAGVAWSLVAAVCYALYMVISEGVMKSFSSYTFVALANTVAYVFIAGPFLVTHDLSFTAVSPAAWAYIAGLAVFSTVLGFVLIFEGIARVGPEKAGIINMSGVPVTLVAAYALLDERMTALQLAGAAVTIAGVTLLRRRKTRPGPEEAP